jgi:hypothetical protein
VCDEVTHDLAAYVIARALSQPERVGERSKALVATSSSKARETVVNPQGGVGFDGKALFAKDQHGATLVTAFGLATSTLDGSDCRPARLFDEVGHDGTALCERRAKASSSFRA